MQFKKGDLIKIKKLRTPFARTDVKAGDFAVYLGDKEPSSGGRLRSHSVFHQRSGKKLTIYTSEFEHV